MSEQLLMRNGILLNFAHTPFVLHEPYMGMECTYETVEHYFQAMKTLFCVGQDWKGAHDWVIEHDDPAIAKTRGRRLKINVEAWDLASFGFMILGHQAKFFQHEKARNALIGTRKKILVEHRPDKIWGDNMDGTGKNLCGKSLMLVREMVVNYW